MGFMERWNTRGVRVLVGLSLLVGCTSDDAPGSGVRDASGPEVTVYRQPVLREEARHPDLDEGLAAVEVHPERLVFTYRDAPASPPTAGEVVTGTLGGGYLRTIVAVSELAPNRYELLTANAELTDYFADVHFKARFEIPAESWSQPGTDGVGARSDALGGSVNLISAELGKCEFESGAVEVGGSFSPVFEMEVDIGFWDGLEEFRFLVGGNIEVFMELATNEGSVSCSWDRTFSSLQKEFTTTFAVGFVPVTVTHTLVPEGKFTIGGEVTIPGVSFEARGGIGFTGGAVYEDDAWRPVTDATRNGSSSFNIEEGGDVTVTARLTAGVNYQAKLYDALGPQMNLGPFISGEAHSDFCDWDTKAEIGLQLNIGARVDVPVIDYSLYEYNSGPIDLITGAIAQGEGTWAWCGGDAGTEDPCSVFSDCDSCASSAGVACGWCDGTCMAETRQGECGGTFVDSRSECVDCSGYGDCGSCVGNGYCGWCPGMGCVNDESPEAAMCSGYQPATCM
ncbi:MAG: hypothetical protein CMN30_33415 [Sandaracinus sp.]|nr:hypothetical protein [Sandaracinus sp.]